MGAPNLWENCLDRLVDFGHAVGQNLEMKALGSSQELMHGEAVATDMAFMTVLSNVMGNLSDSDRDRILRILYTCGLPTYHPMLTRDFFKDAMEDRIKNSMGMRLPLPVGVGKARMFNDVTNAQFEATFPLWERLCAENTVKVGPKVTESGNPEDYVATQIVSEITDAVETKTCVEDALGQLKAMTVVVADTGDVDAIRRLQPEDATTNPTLLLQAVSGANGEALLDRAIQAAHESGTSEDEALVSDVCDRLAVLVGCDILRVVKGLVSTEVDADLSFDTNATLAKARRLMQLYKDAGIDTSRVLIKLGSTWESIEACRKLEQEGIRCNMTLIFSFAQAVACAEAGATLISPFVGRILDWYKKAEGRDFATDDDPGVLSVQRIYKYYKQNGHKTVVMGASFRNTGEILALAGCDKLTIGPKFLDELKQKNEVVERRLDPKIALVAERVPRLTAGSLDEAQFRRHHNEDAMATEKLAEGIRGFAKDLIKLKDLVRARIAAGYNA